MENNPTPVPSTDNTTKPGQVMDIQPTPAASSVITPTTAIASPELVVPAAPVEEQPVAQTEVAPAPTTDAPTEPVVAPDDATSSHNEQSSEVPAPLAAQASPAHKKPILPVIIAVLIAAALIGVAVFAYMQQNKKPAASTGGNSTGQTEAPAKATGADVDSTNKAIDDNLGTTNDAADFDDNTLSDTTLGL